MDTSLQRYWAFLKTAEFESFSRAAEALQYSQPAVSRMVKGLEEELGLQLLQRNSKRVSLTAEGMALLPCIRAVCEAGTQLSERVEELNGLRTGTLRIGCFSSVSTYYLPAVIQRFQKEYPEVSYELLDGDYHSIEDWIREGRVDCGILPLPLRGELDAIPVFRDEFRVVVPKGHPLAGNERFPAAALCNDPFILTEKGGRSSISFYFEEQGLAPDIRYSTWDGYSMLRMVEAGLGIGVLTATILDNAAFDAVALPLEPPLYRDIVFAVKNRRTAPRIVRRFMEQLESGG